MIIVAYIGVTLMALALSIAGIIIIYHYRQDDIERKKIKAS
jgi:hypothetical protein